MVRRHCGVGEGLSEAEEGQLVLYWGRRTTGISAAYGSLEARKRTCALVGLPKIVSGQSVKTTEGCLSVPSWI